MTAVDDQYSVLTPLSSHHFRIYSAFNLRSF